MHKCPFCEKEYKLPHNMVQHLQNTHGYTNDQLQDLYDKLYLKGKRPKCKFHDCDKDAAFISFIKGYRDCCNRGHAAGYSTYLKTGVWSSLHRPDVEEKVKKVFADKFEGGHPGKDPKVHAKGRETLIKLYGEDNPMKVDTIKEKFFSTLEDRYGGRSSQCDPKVREKSKETCRRKYNVEYPGQAEITKQHIKESLEKKYGPGVTSSFQVPEVKEKVLKTFNDNYGGNSPMCSKEVMAKREATLMAMTGGKKSNQALPDVSKKSQKRKRASKGEIGYANALRHTDYCYCEPLFTKEDYFECRPLRYRCKECGKEYEVPGFSYIKTCCEHLSNIEAVVKDYLDKMNITYETKNRQLLDNREIDFYIPEKKLGIECNGMWWHSENHGTDRNYHLDKTTKGLEKGITILHFWEPEILDKFDICASMIYAKLNERFFTKRYRASKLIFKPIDVSKSNIFMNENHIQGSTKGVIYAFALVDENDDIISCIQFTNQRAIFGHVEKHDNVAELVRFATKLYCKVHGGFSKLIKNSIPILKENGKTEIHTYCDRRFSPDANNTVYMKNGFTLIETTKPSYWYCDNEGMKHRYTYTKKALVEMYGDTIADIKDKTEDQITKELGIFKLWDCGQFKLKLDI